MLIQFVSSHLGLLSTLVVAVMDLLFAVNSKAASNGILHWVYLQLKSLGTKQPPQIPPAA